MSTSSALEQRFYSTTPVFQSLRGSTSGGPKVFYKMECYQPSGSFKIRGMEVLLKDLYRKGHRKVIATSGGNAGYSLAYIAKQMAVQLLLYVPETTSEYMIAKIKNLDVSVEIKGRSWDETHSYALALSEENKIPYVPPFDHPLLWKGHATLIDECAKEMEEPDKIVVAVGGGGLLCGVLEGMQRNYWNSAKVVVAETEGAASFAKSFKANKLVELGEIQTIATSLGAKKIAAKALERAKNFAMETYVTSDKEAFLACKDLFEEYHVMVEPACGAALSYLHSEQNRRDPSERILVIVCGGVNMGIQQFQEYKNLFSKTTKIEGEK